MDCLKIVEKLFLTHACGTSLWIYCQIDDNFMWYVYELVQGQKINARPSETITTIMIKMLYLFVFIAKL